MAALSGGLERRETVMMKHGSTRGTWARVGGLILVALVIGSGPGAVFAGAPAAAAAGATPAPRTHATITSLPKHTQIRARAPRVARATRGAVSRARLAGSRPSDAPAPPTVSFTAESAAPGAQIGVDGAGFTAYEGIDVLFDGRPDGAFSASYDGSSQANQSITVPGDATAGAHRVRFLGRNSDRQVTVPLRVYTLAAAPYQAAPGATVAVTAAGLAPNQPVTLTLAPDAATPVVLYQGSTTGGGALGVSSVVVPATTAVSLGGCASTTARASRS